MADRSITPALDDHYRVSEGQFAGSPGVKIIDLGDGTYAYAMSDFGGLFANITTATTTVVKSGAGTLLRVINNKLVLSGVITIYDNTSATGTKIATITNPATLLTNQLVLPYGVRFATGLTIVTSAAEDLTIVYR